MDHFASTTVPGGLADDPTAVLELCTRYAADDCFQYASTGFLLHRPRAYVESNGVVQGGLRRARALPALLLGRRWVADAHGWAPEFAIGKHVFRQKPTGGGNVVCTTGCSTATRERLAGP